VLAPLILADAVGWHCMLLYRFGYNWN